MVLVKRMIGPVGCWSTKINSSEISLFQCSALSPDDGEARDAQPVDSQQMDLAGQRSGWVMKAAEITTGSGSGDSSTHNDDLDKHTADDTPVDTGA